MAWCPFAIHKPLSENHLQGSIVPRAIVLHTAVSSSASLFDFFQNNSDLESHFYVRDDGTVEQYMDTQVRADANKNANDFAVSIESQDGGQIVPWTAAAVNGIVRLVDWLCSTHGIPRVQIPVWNGSGIGWHVMFGAPGPWTPVSKSCPGGPRIDQTKTVIIPRVAARKIEGDDLLADERNAVLSTWAAVFAKGGAQGDQSIIDRLVEIQRNTRMLPAVVAAVTNDPDIDVEQVGELLNRAVAEHTPSAEEIAAAQRPFLIEVVHEALGEDNKDQADRIVDELVSRLANPTPEGN